MKKIDEQANTWLFKVVIFFIVAGFLLNLIPLAKAQSAHQRREHLLNDFHARGRKSNGSLCCNAHSRRVYGCAVRSTGHANGWSTEKVQNQNQIRMFII